MASDDPPAKERAARAAAARKETEHLLAAFDRPGRAPRSPAKQRDFVDYHLDKRRSDPDSAARSSGESERDRPTAIIPRERRRRIPSWLGWGALLVLMAVGGVSVAAALISGPTTPAAPASKATSSPTVAALPSAIPTVGEATDGPQRDIPSPPPSLDPIANPEPVLTPVISAAPPTPPPRRRPPSTGPAAPSSSSASTPSASPSAPASAAPNDEFIRNL